MSFLKKLFARPEPPTPEPPAFTLEPTEVVYLFMDYPCVLKYYELTAAKTNNDVIALVLRGVLDAARRGIPRADARHQYIKPWTDGFSLAGHVAEAIRRNIECDLAMLPEGVLIKETNDVLHGIRLTLTSENRLREVKCSV